MIAENIKSIETSIEQACANAQRLPKDVNIIAVTKYTDSQTAKEVLPYGIRHFGENRVDKMLEKQKELADEAIIWHFIGTLQRRKVKEIINYIDYFHALDNLKLAEEIDKRAQKTIDCFVQVNVSKEASKQGIFVEETMEFIKSLAPFVHIRVVGLMTMAPIDAKTSELRQIFSTLKNLRLEIQKNSFNHAPCTELSMGMSRDYLIAIEEGATFIRIGSAFFNKNSKEDTDGTIR